MCYAYRLGVDKSIYRTNDDGEPSNSAGAPILGQIQSYDLTNILIGVLRYYGGTKLGVGGLINAYRTASKDAIEKGKIVEKELSVTLSLTFTYADMPHIMHTLKENNITITKQEFETECLLHIEVALTKKEGVLSLLQQFESIKINELHIK